MEREQDFFCSVERMIGGDSLITPSAIECSLADILIIYKTIENHVENDQYNDLWAEKLVYVNFPAWFQEVRWNVRE